MGISDLSLRDFPATGGQAAGVKILDIEAAGQAKLKEGGKEEDGSPLKTPQLELTQDGKVQLALAAEFSAAVVCVCVFSACTPAPHTDGAGELAGAFCRPA